MRCLPAIDLMSCAVLSGAVILVAIAYITNNLFNKTHWPIYWLALFSSKKES